MMASVSVSSSSQVDRNYLNLNVLTWNVAGVMPTLEDIQSLFHSESHGEDVLNTTDILAVGLQEAYPNVQDALVAAIPVVGHDQLVDDFSTVLNASDFVRLSYSRIVGIVIMIFVKRPLLCYIQDVDTATYRTGLGGFWGNKGATSIRFMLGRELNVVFTNCHLVPHNENNEKRIMELHDILLYSTFSNQVYTTILQHDVVVLFGDLNFRLEGNEYDHVVSTLANGDQKSLIKADQLYLEQLKGSSSPSHLHRFMEMELEFAPTYKFEPGTDQYQNAGKGRAPAWTDRVLWYINSSALPQVTDRVPKLVIKPCWYEIHMSPRTSDHKAVSAKLNILVDIGMNPRVMFRLSEWFCGIKGNVEFDVAPGTVVSSWDWIGIYPEHFSCVEKDYVSWMYTPAIKGIASRITYYSKPLSPNEVPSISGRYLLIYKSSHYKTVLGMSPLFKIEHSNH
jgi:inositol-1,4,5-trisphosphate 5-phosphatase